MVERIGGVWHHNTYPGAACDVPSHLYEFSFAPNPYWSRRYATQPEIQAYVEDVAGRYGVRDRIRTNTEVLSARWDDARNRWLMKTMRSSTGSEPIAGDHQADVLITACGQLSVPKLPAIKGLEVFEGPAFHTAEWRHSVDLSGKRVAVIGSGCSAIQVVPAIQPIVDRLAVYQRSPAWTIPRVDFAYSPRAQRAFARFPALQRLDRGATFGFFEFGTLALTSQPWLRPAFRVVARRQITKAISDPDLRRKLTPPDAVGCKRVMPTDAWYPTLTRPNVELITGPIAEVTGHGIRTQDGDERHADVIIFATGFQTHGLVTPMEVTGEDDRTLAQAWAGAPRISRPEHSGLPEPLPALWPQHRWRRRLGRLHDRGWHAARHLGTRCSQAGGRVNGSRFASRPLTASTPNSGRRWQVRCGTPAARTGTWTRTAIIPINGRGLLRPTAGVRPGSTQRRMTSGFAKRPEIPRNSASPFGASGFPEDRSRLVIQPTSMREYSASGVRHQILRNWQAASSG